MLTYDIIIKHLMPAINTFSLQHNIVMKSMDFSFFSKLFDDTFYRIGMNCDTNNSTNNSLLPSINYCLSNNNDITNYNNINNCIDDIIKKLDINIIIFDFKNNKIMMEYNKDFFNPWKPTLFLANYDELWEPIICKDTKLFSFSSPKAHILKNNILNQNITRMNGDNININDNFEEIINIEGFNINEFNQEINDEDNIKDTFIITEKPPKTQLNKMKKDELIDLCKKLNKNINISKPTKKDLIDLIST
jgi:hypothetical protein